MEYIWTLLTAAAPIAELRGAIPLALGVYKMPIATAFILAIIGNMIPVFFILWFLNAVCSAKDIPGKLIIFDFFVLGL